MKKLSIFITTLLILFLITKPAFAFCGFYVAKADKSLYNKASQVIIARDDQKTVLTMANDYQGDLKDFALVVPVPVILKEEQVHIGEPKILERLDTFSAPRLVEYFDSDPCAVYEQRYRSNAVPAPTAAQEMDKTARDSSLGVTVEEQFTVGEYDIVILSAKESNGLETWLRQNSYKIPKGASQLLQPYIRQNLKFFVAKVNLKEYSKTGFNALRPLQMAYESPKFMLPIRLGMLNSKGEQDLLIYLLSPKGRIELTNYRTVKIPSDAEIPEFVQKEFTNFYKSMFQKSYSQEAKKVAFLEYAWDMGSCDPCSAEPLNPIELRQAGVFWLNENQFSNAFISRLHVRYSRDKFSEDLQFQQTTNRESFQGRYVMRRPFRGEMKCTAAATYKNNVKNRQEKEAQTLAKLTGWDINQIRSKIDFLKATPSPWWRNLWQ